MNVLLPAVVLQEQSVGTVKRDYEIFVKPNGKIPKRRAHVI